MKREPMSGRENFLELEGRKKILREESGGPMGRFEAAKRHEKMERRGRIGPTGPGERHPLTTRGRLCWRWGAGVGCGEGRWGREREELQGEKQMGGTAMGEMPC